MSSVRMAPRDALSFPCSPSLAPPAQASTLPLASYPNNTASCSPSSLSPAARPFLSSGRSKTQRWEDASPPASSDDSSPSAVATYRDAVLSRPAPKPAPPPAALRPVLHLVVGFSSVGSLPDDGWQLVRRRRSRRGNPPQAQQPPRRGVPEDL
jgi:hypothetical protein